MSTFIKNIKEHKLIALICLLLVAGLITAVILVNRPSGEDTKENTESTAETEDTATEYFKEYDYPVKLTNSDGKLTLVLDGSKTPDLKWETVSETTGVVQISQNGEESEGKLTSVISPIAVGYSTVSYKRTTEMAGYSVDLVTVTAEIMVYEDESSNFVIDISDIRETGSDIGAADTEYPFILKDNRVILPNGGDWTLEPSSEAPAELFAVMNGVDENDVVYFQVGIRPEKILGEDGVINTAALSSPLILKSESLGIEQKIVCSADSVSSLILKKVEG